MTASEKLMYPEKLEGLFRFVLVYIRRAGNLYPERLLGIIPSQSHLHSVVEADTNRLGCSCYHPLHLSTRLFPRRFL